MSGKRDQKVDASRYYHAKYVSYSRAIGVMWAVLTVCYGIILSVCLIQPRWIGTPSTGTYKAGEKDGGFFGLYEYGYNEWEGDLLTYHEKGGFLDLGNILSGSFSAAFMFVGIGVVGILICVLLFVLFFFVDSSKVFFACAWIQLIVAILTLLAVLIYPGGWDSSMVRQVCGSSSYSLGKCSIQWAYILAILGAGDGIVLTTLAFILATRQIKLMPWDRDAKDSKESNRSDRSNSEDVAETRFQTASESNGSATKLTEQNTDLSSHLTSGSNSSHIHRQRNSARNSLNENGFQLHINPNLEMNDEVDNHSSRL